MLSTAQDLGTLWGILYRSPPCFVLLIFLKWAFETDLEYISFSAGKLPACLPLLEGSILNLYSESISSGLNSYNLRQLKTCRSAPRRDKQNK